MTETAFDDYIENYLEKFKELAKSNPEAAREQAKQSLINAGILDKDGNLILLIS